MAWLIDPVTTHLYTTSRTITWHHAMTATFSRSDDTNDPTTGATKATMPRIEIGTDATVIAVGDDTKKLSQNRWHGRLARANVSACERRP